MDKVLKKHKRLLLASILFTIALPVGIFCIIFGAIKGITALLIVGIILTVCGFYGTPVLWIKASDTKAYVNLCYVIEKDKLMAISAIATQIGSTEENCKTKIKTAISLRYLEGYRIDDDEKNIVPLKEQEEKTIAIKCPSCGAKSMIKESNPFCPYCNSPIEIKKGK